MRITAGEFRGRRIKSPPGTLTRPTSERVREALFSILRPPEAHFLVLDLFAGSGILGLEALSRGARRVLFAERDERAVRCIRGNVQALHMLDRTTIVQRDAIAVAKSQAEQGCCFHWIFADPPYASVLAEATVRAVDEGNLLEKSGVLAIEHGKQTTLDDRVGDLVRTSSRRYGDTALSFYQRDPS